MDEVIEEIARECAEALVVVESDPPGMGYVCVGQSVRALTMNSDVAGVRAARAREDVGSAVARALRRLRDEMNAGPLPPPVPETRLAEIESFIADILAAGRPGEPVPQWLASLSALLAHVDHLGRLVRLLAQESEGQAFAAGLAEGRRLGAKEQKVADVLAADALRREFDYRVADRFRDAVRDAPLAADPEGASHA